MITKIINEEIYFEIEEKGEIIVSEENPIEGVIPGGTTFETVSPEFIDNTLPSAPLRIEATLKSYWTGVRSCSRVSVLKSNVDIVANRWIKDQLFLHRDLKFVRYGGTYSNGSYHNGRTPFPERKRYCSGSCSFPIFIEFTNY